jgi:hypothetical protein
MARFKYLQNNFIAGELSPKAWGRFDTEVIRRGCKQMENFISYPQGGAFRRPGTNYLKTEADLKIDPVAARLGLVNIIPFSMGGINYFATFSAQDTGDVLARTTTDQHGVQVFRAGTLAECSVAVTVSEYTSLDFMRFTGFGNFGTTEGLNNLQYVVVNEVIFFAHRAVMPFALVRTGVNSFRLLPFWAYHLLNPGRAFATASFSNTEAAKAWAYLPVNTSTITITSSAASGTVTLTASSAFFTAGLVGSVIRLNTGYVLVTAFTSATVVTGTTLVNVPTTAQTNYSMPAWYVPLNDGIASANSCPRTIAYFNNRLLYGGAVSNPSGLWGTAAGDLAKVETPTSGTPTDADPFSLTIASRTGSPIQWIVAEDRVNIGTLREEYIANLDRPTTAPDIRVQTNFGSDYVQADRLGNTTIFAQRGGQIIRDLKYNFDDDNYRSEDISIFSDHLLKRSRELRFLVDVTTYPFLTTNPRVVKIVQQQAPLNIVWFLDNNGVLTSLTRDRENGVLSWSRHRLGGRSRLKNISDADLGVDRPPKILSIGVLPGSSYDDVYLVVERTVGTTQKIFIERMNRDGVADAMEQSSGLDTMDILNYLDGAKYLTYGSPTSVITGLSDFEDEEVSVVADGKYLGEFTVDSGEITIPIASRRVWVGYKVRAVLQPIFLEEGSVIGTAQGTLKRIDELFLRLNRTSHVKIGPSLDNLTELKLRPSTVPLADPIPLYTGDKVEKFEGTYDPEAPVYIVCDAPLPCSVTAIASKGIVYD